MSIRWLQFLALACLTALIIWGCQIVPSRFTDENLNAAQPIVIKLSGWGASPAERRSLQQVLRQFEATHPMIHVKFEEIVDQYMDVMKTRLIGDAAPDVFYLDSLEAPFLMANDVLEPLNTYIIPEFDLADFEPQLLAAFQVQDQIFGLPKDYSTLALFYNTNAFAEAGIPQPPRTWDELRTIAKQLTIDRNQDGKPEQYGLGILPELARVAYMIRALGGELVDEQGYATFASPNGLEGLQQLVDQYRIDRTAVRPADVGANSGTELFGQGKAAMVIEGNWAIPFLADTFPDMNYATAEVPTLNTQPGTMSYTVAYVMNRQSQHKPEAWELISYLTGKEGMTQWTSTGISLPTRKSVATALQFDRDPLRSALVAGASYALPWQIGTYPSAIMNHFNNQFLSVMLGEQSLPLALHRAQENANRQIRASN